MCYIILYNELFYEKQAEPRIIPAAAACRRGTADARRERMFFNVSSYNDRMCYRRAFGSSSDSVLSFHSEKGSAVFTAVMAAVGGLSILSSVLIFVGTVLRF